MAKGSRERVVPYSATIGELLRAYLAHRRPLLQANLPQFSAHTFRHLCLTDLARSGWELHQIAQFAGHRNPATTLLYIHLSGQDLAEQLTPGMSHIHAWRVQTLAHTFLDRTPTEEVQ